MFCRYFQAKISSPHVWLVTAILRGCEHIVFDRTLDVRNSLFEFFVPIDCLETFLAIMQLFQQRGIINQFVELPNRLQLQDVREPLLYQEPQ
jgi:hypothetical protein